MRRKKFEKQDDDSSSFCTSSFSSSRYNDQAKPNDIKIDDESVQRIKKDETIQDTNPHNLMSSTLKTY